MLPLPRVLRSRDVIRPTVLLFDIDGTLVDTGGAGRRSMVGAFLDVTGRDDACAKMVFAGMTDRAIGREGLRAAGLEPTEALIDAVLDAYLTRLAAEVAASEGYRLMPGVVETLAWLAELAERGASGAGGGVAVGLGTGNVERGAYTKLARGAIDRAFTFGGFGSDAEDRAELLAVGARRGAESLGVATEACRVVVIGDTPKDVDAALRMGAECIGVATGGYTAATLAGHGAHWSFETLLADGVRDALVQPSAARSSGT
jgi:phosphoglycolate phosphatase